MPKSPVTLVSTGAGQTVAAIVRNEFRDDRRCKCEAVQRKTMPTPAEPDEVLSVFPVPDEIVQTRFVHNHVTPPEFVELHVFPPVCGEEFVVLPDGDLRLLLPFGLKHRLDIEPLIPRKEMPFAP